MIYVVVLEALLAQISIYLDKKVTIMDKYSDFIDFFLEKKNLMLLNQIKLYKYTIELENSKQSAYRLIYSLDLVNFKTLKIYIKTHLKIKFI